MVARRGGAQFGQIERAEAAPRRLLTSGGGGLTRPDGAFVGTRRPLGGEGAGAKTPGAVDLSPSSTPGANF